VTRHLSADVVVVGAGPAGSATALLLARAGHDVLLVDRAAFPRAKPCGDCLSAAAGAVLERLGVLGDIESAAPARLAGWRIHAPNGHWFDGAFPPRRGGAGATDTPPSSAAGACAALALPRERLDALLLGAAQRAGARLLEARISDVIPPDQGGGPILHGRGPDGAALSVRARLVVGADGLRSIVARRLGLVRREPRLRKLSLTAHAHGIPGLALDVSGTPPTLMRGEMHVSDGACVGVAPVQSGPDSLVVDARRFAAQVADDRRGFFRAMLGRFPALRGRLERLTLVPHAGGRRLLASGPFDWSMREVVGPGVALVGDAAGYYDPFTGQGIYQALASAELLAQEADAALWAHGSGGALPALVEYARRRSELLRGARALQRGIEAVLSRPWLANAAIARLGRSREAADALVAVTGDLRPAGSLLDPRLVLGVLVPNHLRRGAEMVR